MTTASSLPPPGPIETHARPPRPRSAPLRKPVVVGGHLQQGSGGLGTGGTGAPFFQAPKLYAATDPFEPDDRYKADGARAHDDDDDDEERAHHAGIMELQDDSFVTFSVGHLNRRHFSEQVAKYARAVARADDMSDDSCPRVRESMWRRRKREAKSRKQQRKPPLRNDRANPLLAPVKRCFYY